MLTDRHKRYFEKLVIYCDQYASLIPLSFVLGVFPLQFPVPHPPPPETIHAFWGPPLLPLWDAPQIQPHRPPFLRPLDRCGPLDITWSPAPGEFHVTEGLPLATSGTAPVSA